MIYIMQPADRISNIKPYFFSSLGKKLVEMREEGIDVIRIDMGSPDLPPAKHIIDTLVNLAQLENKHGYTLGSGTQEFRKAVAAYYKTRFGVDLDPQCEVIDLIGSKEGSFIISQVVLNPGDVSLIPDPGYGVYASGAIVAGAEIIRMPLIEKNNFLLDLSLISEDDAKRAKLLWLNYPNNPTGAIADLDFFKTTIDFAKKYDLFIVHDAPYAEVCFDGYQAPSILEVAGAKKYAIEFNSFSKAYNMAGWRLGMAVGNKEALKYIESYKSLQDSAIFAPILAAGVEALSGDQSWLSDRNIIYKERRDIVVESLCNAGLEVKTPKAALYVWVPVPSGWSSMDFCAKLLQDTGVSTTPGNVFGDHGEGYFRISLVTTAPQMQEAMTRIVKWLGEYGFKKTD